MMMINQKNRQISGEIMKTKRSLWSAVGIAAALLLLVTLLAMMAPIQLSAGHPLDDEGPAPETQIDPWKPPRAAGPYAPVIDPDPIIQDMMDQVLTQTVILYDGGLSGEWPVTIGGNPYTIATRYTYSGVPISKTTQYVGEHLANLGMAVEYHTWGGATYPNVIGEITGATNPEEIYMIVAHLDDMPPGSLAPGADDNASGSAGVMIAADILSQYAWDCTLRFAFFTGEEQGLVGSYYYAQRSYGLGENIEGVLNMDMIGWNTPNSPNNFDLHADSALPATISMAQVFSDVVSTYNLDLIPEIVPNGISGSDHYSFWQYGYPAILTIEDLSDFNPYYHSTQDTLDKLDIDYFTDLVRANVGTFAHLTNCMAEVDGTLTGQVTNSENNDPIEDATIWTGDIPLANTDGQGYYTATFPAGVYTFTATAEGFSDQTMPGVTITNGATTTLNFSLNPLPPIGTVTGRVTDAIDGTPIPAASVVISDVYPIITNMQGYYTLTVPVGVYSMTVSANGYLSQTRGNVTVTNATITIQDFSLQPDAYLLYLPVIAHKP
jgi:hypothetical protein